MPEETTPSQPVQPAENVPVAEPTTEVIDATDPEEATTGDVKVTVTPHPTPEPQTDQKPKLGNCPICFAQYAMRMRNPRLGKAALMGTRGLKTSDFEENFTEFATLLSTSSIMNISVCKTCYATLDQAKAEVAFANTKEIDRESIRRSKLPDVYKEKSLKNCDTYDMLFWSKDPNEVMGKKGELFPDLVV